MRQALETPGKSAALVTPDRSLARRVAAELKRWDIAIDDSAGRPLAHTSAGSFLCLVAEAAEARFAPVPLLALLKHPFARHSSNMEDGEAAAFRAMARALDLALRGARPDPGLAGVTQILAGNPDAVRGWWHGVKLPGTALPDVLTAGSFYQHGGMVFYDVHDPERTIVVELEHEHYQRLIVEVADPAGAVPCCRTHFREARIVSDSASNVQ